MCGIFGLIWHGSELVPDQAKLSQTAQLLQHRGPDSFGIHSEKGIGLVHTRLSLLDPNPRSNQPFWDASHRHVLVYNGEIYNFAELRTELEQAGVQFRTTSDTEVLLEAVLHWGAEAALPRFEGMFAFGIYDTVERNLIVARDAFGIKPVFVYETGDTFVFASEVQAMRPWVAFDPDLPSISSFLMGFSGPTRGATFYRHVKILDPGGLIRLTKGGQASYSQFRSLEQMVDPGESEALGQCQPSKLIDRVDELLNASVQSQLVADAPVGALCSGGLDSSIIVAMAARHHNNLAIFHANVLGPLSEFEAAQRLAKHLRLDMKSVNVTDEDFIEKIPDVMEHYGHPFYPCPHSVPFLMVARLIRENRVKAVLSGEGADECFLGYKPLLPKLRDTIGLRPLLRRVRNFVRGKPAAHRVPFAGLDYIRGGDGRSDTSLVLAMHNRCEVFEDSLQVREALRAVVQPDVYQSASTTLDLLHYNLRALLHRNDCMGMEASLESRFPFLDSALVRTSINLPYQAKIRFTPGWPSPERRMFTDKWVLREVGKRYLPKFISQREKKPFPTSAYSQQRLLIQDGFFKKTFVAELLGLSSKQMDCVVSHASHDLKWKIVQLDVWAQVSLYGYPKRNAAAKLQTCLSVRK